MGGGRAGDVVERDEWMGDYVLEYRTFVLYDINSKPADPLFPISHSNKSS